MPADLIALIELLTYGFNALYDYVANHAICLLVAFFIAGAISAFMPRDVILKYLGSRSRKIISFPLAAIMGMFLTACSCTIIPIAAGLYRKGSSIGTAFIILWTTPAVSLMALIYTGSILGFEMAFWRAAIAISLAILVGTILSAAFSKEEMARSGNYGEGSAISVKELGKSLVPVILLLLVIIVPRYLGIDGLHPVRALIFAITILVVAAYTLAVFGKDMIEVWLRETAWFVKQILPFLLIGVFVVGIVSEILPGDIVYAYLGSNTLWSTLLASVIGALSYIATLTEAPLVHALMKLGMGKGPALALLLTGPGVSLPNMLTIAKLFGWKKAAIYVITIVVLTTITVYTLSALLRW